MAAVDLDCGGAADEQLGNQFMRFVWHDAGVGEQFGVHRDDRCRVHHVQPDDEASAPEIEGSALAVNVHIKNASLYILNEHLGRGALLCFACGRHRGLLFQ